MDKRIEYIEQRLSDLEKKVAAGTTTELEMAKRFQASKRSDTEFCFIRNQ